MEFLIFVAICTILVAEIALINQFSMIKIGRFWHIAAAIGITYLNIQAVELVFSFKTFDELAIYIVSYALCAICFGKIIDIYII